MRRINIGGREITLAWTMGAWCDVEERLFPLAKLNDVMSTPTGNAAQTLELLEILGNEGQISLKQQPDISVEWLRVHMPPKLFGIAKTAILQAIGDGMTMENGSTDEVHDVILEQIEKKGEQDA